MPEEIKIDKFEGVTKSGNPYTAFKFIAGDYESPAFFPDKIHSDYLLLHFFNGDDYQE